MRTWEAGAPRSLPYFTPTSNGSPPRYLHAVRCLALVLALEPQQIPGSGPPDKE